MIVSAWWRCRLRLLSPVPCPLTRFVGDKKLFYLKGSFNKYLWPGRNRRPLVAWHIHQRSGTVIRKALGVDALLAMKENGPIRIQNIKDVLTNRSIERIGRGDHAKNMLTNQNIFGVPELLRGDCEGMSAWLLRYLFCFVCYDIFVWYCFFVLF